MASRAHRADVGGATPGSMPPHSRSIDEDGILIDNFPIVSAGRFRERQVVNVLSSGSHPARSVAQNVAGSRPQFDADQSVAW